MTHARQSRRGWPDRDEPETQPAPTATDAVVASLKRAVMTLMVFVLMLAVAVAGLLYYVFGRSQYRDAQQRAAEEQFRVGICDVLDGLPAGALLQPARDKYGCGPGVPVDELSPEVLGNLQQFGTVIPQPDEPLDRVKPTPDSAAQPAEPSQEPPAQPAPAASTPAPTMEPTPGLPPVEPTPAPAQPTLPPTPPLIDLTPITDPVCAGLGICL